MTSRGAITSRRHGFGAVVRSKIDEVAHQPNEYTIICNMIGSPRVLAHLYAAAGTFIVLDSYNNLTRGRKIHD